MAAKRIPRLRGRKVNVTLVEAGNPAVIIRAADLGASVRDLWSRLGLSGRACCRGSKA